MGNISSKRPICRTTEEVEEMIREIFFDDKHTLKEYIGGQHIQPGSIEEIMKQFICIREKFHSPAGIQAVRMGTKVKDEGEKAIGLDRLYQMSQELCGLYPDYQILFGLYRDEEGLRIYFVLNTVSVKDGSKYNPTLEEHYEIQDKKKAIAEQYIKEAGDL